MKKIIIWLKDIGHSIFIKPLLNISSIKKAWQERKTKSAPLVPVETLCCSWHLRNNVQKCYTHTHTHTHIYIRLHLECLSCTFTPFRLVAYMTIKHGRSWRPKKKVWHFQSIFRTLFLFKRTIESLFPFLKADILVHYSTLLSNTKQYFNSQTVLQRFIWIDLALVE